LHLHGKISFLKAASVDAMWKTIEAVITTNFMWTGDFIERRIRLILAEEEVLEALGYDIIDVSSAKSGLLGMNGESLEIVQ
jgi:hypothetical protein